MMTALQWVGMMGVVVAYLFYVTLPRLAACITIAGCVAILTWSLLLTPVAWGVTALEGTVILISLFNLWKLRCTGSNTRP
jgi:hypothetical protein